ncbi:hypothetical protein HQQ94_14955 [Shewanella sp. VB17]|uniref:hypothetical protein n=1 Tax=Shewanella sp. VB17 TaxID=2739432 RepID=UPI00156323A4|nr:hypothetical protein [Shewanella sp. VB17]NRD74512.1 hypothetical protein [Shewanella sp. VB17]
MAIEMSAFSGTAKVNERLSLIDNGQGTLTIYSEGELVQVLQHHVEAWNHLSAKFTLHLNLMA